MDEHFEYDCDDGYEPDAGDLGYEGFDRVVIPLPVPNALLRRRLGIAPRCAPRVMPRLRMPRARARGHRSRRRSAAAARTSGTDPGEPGEPAPPARRDGRVAA